MRDTLILAALGAHIETTEKTIQKIETSYASNLDFSNTEWRDKLILSNQVIIMSALRYLLEGD